MVEVGLKGIIITEALKQKNKKEFFSFSRELLKEENIFIPYTSSWFLNKNDLRT